MFCPPNVAIPVKAGLARGAYPVKEGIWLVVAMLCPPNVAAPVKAGLVKGVYLVKVGIWLVVAMFCPPKIAVPVKTGLARDALLFSCVWKTLYKDKRFLWGATCKCVSV